MKKLAFIGGGNMAAALINGLLGAGLYQPKELLVSDTLARQLNKIKRAYGVEGIRHNRLAARQAETVLLAVKPQIMDEVLADLAAEVAPTKLFVSIAAGVSLRRLQAGLGGQARVVRVMPNTPALVGRGMAVIVRGHKATARDERLGLRLFRGVGEAVAVRDERLLDPVTGLSGSGPAYVYLFAEALIAGGVQQGLSQKAATQLTLQTLEGAVAMLKEAGRSPQELREMVSSPGGTTLAGLARLEKGRFSATVVAAVAAATRRSGELGRA